MEKLSKFLGTDGLTQTSANHIANIAKEMYEALETKMESIRLFNRDYTLAINGKTYRVENESAKEELATLSDSIREVAALKSLIAWLREGIKAKTMISSVDQENKYIEDLIKDGRKDLEIPDMDFDITFETVLSDMGEDTMARYYSLEAKCATLGKFILMELLPRRGRTSSLQLRIRLQSPEKGRRQRLPPSQQPFLPGMSMASSLRCRKLTVPFRLNSTSSSLRLMPRLMKNTRYSLRSTESNLKKYRRLVGKFSFYVPARSKLSR